MPFAPAYTLDIDVGSYMENGIHQPTAPGASLDDLVACEGCDLLHRRTRLPPGSTAKCRRCGHALYSHRVGGIERGLALTIASSVFFVLANVFPFMSIEIQGIKQEITLLSASLELFRQGMPDVAIFSASIIFFFPLLQLLGTMAVLVPLFRRKPSRFGKAALKTISLVAPWSMMEIYLLGVLVSLVKLVTLADVHLGVAFWAFTALIFTNTWTAVSLDRHCLWHYYEKNNERA
jgi:paraquat-inducible protein A